MLNCPVISSDDHVWEPRDLWTTRLDEQFRERAPRIAQIDGAGDAWVTWQGEFIIDATGAAAQPGVRFENPSELKRAHHRYEDAHPGGSDPIARLEAMDLDGIDASILYPGCGQNVYRVPETPLLDAVCRVYNDWLAEYCSAEPSRLKGIGILNVDDIETATEELERCAELGHVGCMIPVYPPEDRFYSLPEYDRLWAAAQDLDMPISLHVLSHRDSENHQFLALIRTDAAFEVNVDHWVRTSLGQIILSGVFQRFPRLKVGSVEHEISWAITFLQGMDYTYTQRPFNDDWSRFDEGILPSDYFRNNCFISFQEDPLGVQSREFIGTDILMWGSDFPHEESTFPHSREVLARILNGCTELEKAKLVGGNAARLYGL